MPTRTKDEPDPYADGELDSAAPLADDPVVPAADPAVVEPAAEPGAVDPAPLVDELPLPPITALVSMKLPDAPAARLLELPLVPVAPLALLPEPELRQPVTTTSFLLVLGLLPICPFAS